MEEEPEVYVSTTLEESLSTENVKPTKLNKNGKPKREMTPEALERLAKAREKANAMRQQNYAKKLEEKAKNIKEKNEIAKPEQKPVSAPSVGEELPYEEVEIVKEKPKSKPKGKKKTKIIVEQSSEDSDEFENNDRVVFVKRVSRKKREPDVEPQPPPVVRQEPIPEPPKPQRPELTREQRLLKSQYEGMFSGGFMNNNLMRRHY